MCFVICIILLPFFHLLTISLSPTSVAISGGIHLFPKEIIWDNYKETFLNPFIWNGYKNTLIRTVFGTVFQLSMTAVGAYVLSKKVFPHRSFWTLYVVFTMFFSGGLIPSYLLIKNLNLFDSYLAMILPGAVSAYNLVLMRNFFQSLPEDLEESALIDGAGRFRIFYQIVLPVSTPILATIGLWIAVAHWNAWFDVLLYIRDTNKFVLQIILRRILQQNSQEMMDIMSASAAQEQDALTSTPGLQAAFIFITTLPILFVYPFAQKFFVKGIMVGSLKG